MPYHLDITGYNPRKRRVESVVRWFLQKYLPRHHIYIEILHRGLLREGVYGWCDIVGRTYNPREFLIEIHNRLNEEDYIKVLFHELTHLMDFVKGDLKLKSSKKYYKGIDVESMDYEDQPHEIRAYKMERILYEEYLEYLNN